MRPQRSLLQNHLRAVRPSNAFLFIRFRTLLHDGALPTHLESIACALFASQRRGGGWRRTTSSLSYILPSYVCSKSLVSHSYANCRGVPLSSQCGTPRRLQPWYPASGAAPCGNSSVCFPLSTVNCRLLTSSLVESFFIQKEDAS